MKFRRSCGQVVAKFDDDGSSGGADMDLFLLSRGELPPQRRIAVRMHLLTCTACRVRLASFRTTSKLLAEALGGGPRPASPLTRFPVAPIALLLLVAGLFSTVAFVWMERSTAASKVSGPASAAPGDKHDCPNPMMAGAQ